MNDLENLKKKLLYRSNYRGTKEMDILLSSFVKFHINKLSKDELMELDGFLNLEDEFIYNIYQTNEHLNNADFINIISLFKKFKI
jgi:antitoxin CptB|tara:strand:+ start:561 stop:815 length:255 start_codon:yes stop_codon:yes gene_type:complete